MNTTTTPDTNSDTTEKETSASYMQKATKYLQSAGITALILIIGLAMTFSVFLTALNMGNSDEQKPRMLWLIVLTSVSSGAILRAVIHFYTVYKMAMAQAIHLAKRELDGTPGSGPAIHTQSEMSA